MVLGMWLAGSLFMMVVAIGNFQGVERLLEAPEMSARQSIKTLGPESARLLLRHQVGELNRLYFENWEWVQLALGIVLTVTLLFATNGGKIHMLVCGFLLLLVLVERFLITPHVASLGRMLDFVPPGVQSAETTRFWRLHNAYSALEVLKLVTLLGLTGSLLMVGARRRSPVRNKINVVDDTDHG